MTKILFVCHGNICRSTMAEFVLKDLAAKAGLTHQLEIASAATSREEIGNDTHPGTKRKLDEMHIPYTKRKARQLPKPDYAPYDSFLAWIAPTSETCFAFAAAIPTEKSTAYWMTLPIPGILPILGIREILMKPMTMCWKAVSLY